MKKIIIIFSTILVIALSIIPTISAAVIPTNSFTPIYAIKLSDESTVDEIPIWSLDYDEIAMLPAGFTVYGYKNQYVQGDINHVLTLRDGSRFVYTSNGSSFSLVYRCVYQNGLNNGANTDFTVINNQSSSLDFIFVVTSQGFIGYILFDNTGNVYTTNITTVPFYTNVDPYYAEDEYENGYVDGYNTGFDEGYDSGYNRGYSSGVNSGELSGYEKGYVAGGNDATNRYNESFEEIIAEERIDAYNKGYEQAITDSSGDYINGFNAGVIKGQNDAKIPVVVIEGFWSSIRDFFSSFLSIGIGNLTLYSLLGVVVVVSLAILLVKLIRG